MTNAAQTIPVTANPDRIDSLLTRLADCDVCPQNCHTDRYSGTDGKCEMGADVMISSANLHFGEEPPLSGSRGSGTIFLTGCNMRCVYCQNYPISQLRHGNRLTSSQLVDTMLNLQERGAHNVNFVTPTHFTPQLAEGIDSARNAGLTIPIVWNSSGYEKVEVLEQLEGLVDVYLPDMRYNDAEYSMCYSNAPDYPEVNRLAIKEMFRQVGLLEMDKEDVAIRGLIIRHLVLPEFISGTKDVLRFIAEEISRECAVSLMSQYFPAHRAGENKMLSRRITSIEYEQAVSWMDEFGLENGWSQNEEL